MNAEAKKELIRDASALAYAHIRLADLHRLLDNDEWDRLADEWGEQIFNLVDGLVDAKLTEIEASRRAA